MAKKKPSLSTVVSFMSDNAQARIEAQAHPTTTIALTSILPDFSQPRRLLPNDLRAMIETGSLSPIDAMRRWIGQVDAGDNVPGGGRRNIEQLRMLAESIASHGLIAPISVRKVREDEIVPPGIQYLVVTGERRYWAHIYLVSVDKQIHEGDAVLDPAAIKATITASGVTVKAHQLIENLQREDINAVEKAQGMWALRYELSGVNYSSPQDNELNQTGKVNYSSPKLVPWTRVEEALNISKRYRIFVTTVLNLDDDALELVASHNLAEMTIRPIIQKLKTKPDLQLKALNQLIAWLAENETGEGPSRSIVASVKALVDKLSAGGDIREGSSSSPGTRSVSSAPVIRFRNKVRQTLDFLGRLKTRDRDSLTEALRHDEFADIRLDLRNLRQQIDTILDMTDQSPSQNDES